MDFSRVRADGSERIPKDEKWRFYYKRALEIARLRGYS
jgi:hypothetical protein